MQIDIEIIKIILKRIAKCYKENERKLCILDSDIGDGDHGVGMSKIASIIDTRCSGDQDVNISMLFENIGKDIMSDAGGSSGMLWGTYFTGLAEGAVGIDSIDAITLRKMFDAAITEMYTITNAKEGDKTMMDALIPASEAIKQEVGEINCIMRAASIAARKGAVDTENYMAKFGRAKNLKERTLGFMDAGAVSASMFFEAFADAIDQLSERLEERSEQHG